LNVATKSKGAAVRAQLGYPVVDVDGHTLEYGPAVFDFIADVAGPATRDRLMALYDSGEELFGYNPRWYQQTWQERLDRRSIRPGWWMTPAENTLDYATAQLPRLLHERLGEFGFDFCVVYPTSGIAYLTLEEEELRQAACRGINAYHAEVFRGLQDRLTVAAAIPMHTPAEAIDELEYCVNVLGFKAAMIPHFIDRPIAAIAREHPELAREVHWIDCYGIDSAYDYDPFWAKCVELKVALGAHTGGVSRAWGNHRSISNHQFNMIGAFADAGFALCKSLFFGGVTRRFPELRVAALEGGVAWASTLFGDLVERWEKRNGRAVQRYNPAGLDRERLLELIERYGGEVFERTKPRERYRSGELGTRTDREEDPATLDEWGACSIESREDLYELFVPRFYFGCEADDPTMPVAFSNVNAMGARMNAMFGSDIGHWDVPDMSSVLSEAYEQVERGALAEDDLRRFLFDNPVRFYTDMNPNFFKGTAVESAVDGLIAGT
jgi:predicted TIM-barrel fold metal-dependent hydrolase